MPAKTIILLCSDPKEAFRDLRTFCRLTGESYNTWSKKSFPAKFKGMDVLKVKANLTFAHTIGEGIKREVIEVKGYGKL